MTRATKNINTMAETSDNTSAVDLGFLEESETWRLRSYYFPSKVGGKPAWLDLYDLPEKIVCKKCNKPCIFLCQVYAPVEEKNSCFHRTVYVFMCKDPACCQDNDSSNFIVLRCQLSRQNNFYSFYPPIEDENWTPNVMPEQCNLCNVCGAKGPSRCGKCKTVFYCSREHQVIDWKSSHKNECMKGKESDVKPGFLLPQFELVIEPEKIVPDDKGQKGEKSEEERLEFFKSLIRDGKAGTMQDEVSVEELQKMANSDEDKQFSKFTEQIEKNRDQVLRYDRAGSPLWISSMNMAGKNDISICQYCGANRHFEFQILPQMLNSLGLDETGKSIDWGVLSIYTCSQSCDEGPVYKEEFMWKQDIVSTSKS